ncbi:MAG: response regulator transcription factor [Candidatus Hydrogenedentes bacterium]|nr:response regulator transcription factor [Candidatus Hydrogenedentota bacterium]MBI3118407.1 response regulator transcription factor [Candidatus Hydrogenedentota bacterium]
MPVKTSLKLSTPVHRIMIVDDHPLLRRGLSEVISSQQDMTPCGEAPGAAEAFTVIENTNPELVVIDLSLEEGSGLSLIKEIKARFPHIKMLVYSMHDESLFAERSLNAGASGYIRKQESTDRILEAIRQVLQGNVYLSENMTKRMLNRHVGAHLDPDDDKISLLSDRELQVFELIGDGLGTRQVAEKLHLSIKTIESYRESIKRKLDLTTSNELTRHAVQWLLEKTQAL